MSTKKKSQQKSSTEESDIALQQETKSTTGNPQHVVNSPKWSTDRGQEMNSIEQSSSAGTLQQEVNIPERSTSRRNPQEEINSSRQSISAGNSPRVASSPSKTTIRGNSLKAIKSPKQSANGGNSQQEQQERSTRHAGKSTREMNDNENFGSIGMSQQETNTHKSPGTGLPQNISGKKGITRQADVQVSRVGVKPSSNSSKTRQYSDDTEAASDQDNSSSSEKDSGENLKKKLFSSPKENPNKNPSLQGVGNTDQQRTDKSKINQNSPQKSKVTSNVVQKRTLRKKTEHSATEDEISDNGKSPSKKTIVHSVTKENIQNQEEWKRTTNTYTDSESDVMEQIPAPKIPSPPKRVLRARSNKSNNMKTMQKISDVDSEDGTKKTQASVSCDGDSDSTAYSGIGSKTRSRKRNLEKRVVHERVRTLAQETTSTQSSEEDSDGIHRKPSRKQTRPKASRINTEGQKDSGNDKGAKAGSLKGKEKTDGVSNRASAKNQASKVSQETRNKHSSEKQNEISSVETPWSDEEIQRLNEYVYCVVLATMFFTNKNTAE